MKIIKKLFIALVIAITFVGPASAQTEYFVINNFRSSIRLSPDRSAIVNERIDVTFSSPRHGIFRYIPVRYVSKGFSPNIDNEVNILKVVDDGGVSYPYETYKENSNLVIKIGDPSKTVEGAKSYSITYKIDNVVRFFDETEEFVWDVNGTGWGTTVEKISAQVQWDDTVDSVDFACYTGQQGDSDDNCSYKEMDSSAVFESTGALKPYENMTVAVQFPSGAFVEPSFWDVWGRFLLYNSGILLPIFVFIFAHNRWSIYGRDPKGRGVIPVQFDAPANLSPGETGTIADYRVDQIELSATLIDLAIRGYVQIIRTGKGKNDYSFKLLNVDFAKLKQHEKQILEGMFESIKNGEKVTLKSLKNKFYTTSEMVKKDLVQQLTATGYFKKNPRKILAAWMAAGIIILIAGFYSLAIIFGPIGGWLSGVGIILSGIIVIVYALFMPARTLEGVVAYEHIMGLKDYLTVAEEDRLAMMQGPDSRYVGDTTTPKHTVELFEKLLPYAIVLKVEKQWAKKFKDIYNQPPDWYSGHNYAAFNSAMLASDISSASKAISSTMISQPSSSSGSSFSGGGGFSGGGFGGGGGGSW